MNTINNETFDDKSQETEPYQPSQIVEYLTCPNQQTIDLNEFVQNVKKGDIKKPIFNIDYFFFKFQDVRLDYSKGGYSNIEIVKDQKERILIRKTVNNAAAFENELNFFQQMDNKYLVNIYYYSKCDKEFYLEKGDETLYSFFKNKLIKNRFFLFLLCLTLVEAVTSLHLSNIFHGDIKPQNIIIFFKEGFNLDDLQQDKNISISIIEQFLALQSFLRFNFRMNEHFQNVNNNNKDDDINFSNFFKALNEMKDKKTKQIYQNFSEMLEKLFCITIKFIDFQSSSQLNTPQKISFYTKAYTCEDFISKKKNKYLNFIDKIYLDHYSTFRTILMLTNFENIYSFYQLDDTSIIHNTQDFILQSFLLSYQQYLKHYFTDNLATKQMLIQLPFKAKL
ncbi:hypothetical protein ABPG74_003260 [Tetrahymena malaccensis]